MHCPILSLPLIDQICFKSIVSLTLCSHNNLILKMNHPQWWLLWAMLPSHLSGPRLFIWLGLHFHRYSQCLQCPAGPLFWPFYVETTMALFTLHLSLALFKILIDSLFGGSLTGEGLCQGWMCGSRKYPYPPRKGFTFSPPPPLWIFQNQGTEYTPLPSGNSNLPLTPPGNIYLSC